MEETPSCHSCQTPLNAEDFAQGRAMTLLRRPFCEDCLENEVRKGRRGAASADVADDDSVVVRRVTGRSVPSAGARLVVRRGGLFGLLRGDRVRLWLDISEGGFRAILAGRFRVDLRLKGSIAEGGAVYPFRAKVAHVRDSQRYPGCVLAGCLFEAPSPELQFYIRRPPATVPSAARRPASTSIPPPNPARA